MTYSRSKGVFAGLTLEGAVIEQDADSTIAIYGKDVSFRSTLLGEVAPPDTATTFMEEMAKSSHQAHPQEKKDEVKDDKKGQ